MADPSSISGLTLWLDADQLTGLSDGDPVSSFTDFSGGSRHATQGTSAARPTYKTGQLGGKAVVRFDGVDDNLVSDLYSTMFTSTVTWISVQRNWTSGTPVGGSGGAGWLTRSLGGQEFPNSGVFAFNPTAGSATGIRTHAYDYSTPAYQVWNQGTSGGTAFTASAAPGSNNLTVGKWNTGDFLAGDVAEVIVYNKILSAGERATVHSYLQDKYGITVSDYVASTVYTAVPGGLASMYVGQQPTGHSYQIITSGTSAPATTATGTGAAHDATVDVQVTAQTATGTGTAPDAAAAEGAQGGVATGTGTASDAAVAAAANAGAATGTGTALDAAAALGVNADPATGTGAAHDASVSTLNATDAAAQEATGTGQAHDASVALTVNAGTATGTGTAPDAAAAEGAQGGVATGTGAASDAAVALAVNAGAATGSGIAPDATVTTTSGTSPNAGVATGTGTAHEPSVGIRVNADAATGVGQAFGATIDTVIIELTYLFRTPTYRAGHLARGAMPAERGLMRHYAGYRRQGVAVIIWPDLTVEERRVLRGDEHLTARNIFLGGHENVVDVTTASILTSAGYELLEV